MLETLGTAADRTGHPRARILCGLLSVADVATGLPPAVLADELELAPAIRDTLLERRSALGVLLDVVEAHEQGWWEDLFTRCASLGIAPGIVGDAWHAAWQRARAEATARLASDA
jgi:EAL and modified HD-GYP domain-containing signal transduction protein